MATWGFAPFAVNAYNNPETIRMRKYATGAHFVLWGTGTETGRTPREVVWEKGKARLPLRQARASRSASRSPYCWSTP